MCLNSHITFLIGSIYYSSISIKTILYNSISYPQSSGVSNLIFIVFYSFSSVCTIISLITSGGYPFYYYYGCYGYCCSSYYVSYTIGIYNCYLILG